MKDTWQEEDRMTSEKKINANGTEDCRTEECFEDCG